MGKTWIKELTGGLDTRKMAVTSPGGTLIRANNGHITRGGEFEKRAAFVPIYALPVGATKSMAAGKTSLTVFGSDAAPLLPSGVSYQRLQHPSGVALSRVISYDLHAGKIYAVAEFADGSRHHFYDGVRVVDWFDGRAAAIFQVTGGDAVGPSKINDLTVDGVSILPTPVDWATSNSDTAAAIAAAVSHPDYTASSVDNTVRITATLAGAAPNGRVVGFTLASGMALTPSSGIVLAGGSDDASSYVPGTYAKTIGSRIHSVSGANEHFSGIKQPTKFKTDTTGAGFIDMSTYASGSEELTAIAPYSVLVAVFAARVIQLWYFDSDPSLNAIKQVLNNTGTDYPLSVTQFGDDDLFYLDESGCRSLRARDASNSAATTDIGVPVDTLVKEQLAKLGAAQRSMIAGAIEPGEGRFWLCMYDLIFVFSFFNGSKVSAWSTYTPSAFINDGSGGSVEVEFPAENVCVFNKRIYVRSGDTIYVYGGLSGTLQRDATVAEGFLPYIDGNEPTKKKKLSGIDVACEGEWEVALSLDPTEPDAEDSIAYISKTTYPHGRVPAEGEATHFGLRFRSRGAGAAKIGSAVVHHDGKGDDD